MALVKDVPPKEFELKKMLKRSVDTEVSIVLHKPTGKECVLKAYKREEAFKTGMVERVMSERDILRLISGIHVESKDPFKQPQKVVTQSSFPSCLNKLLTTTSNEENVYLVLERA